MFFFLSFLFSGDEEGGTNPTRVKGGGVGASGSEEVVGKGGRRVNTMQKMCTHVYKCKNDTC
jgi:hypothetical protein